MRSRTSLLASTVGALLVAVGLVLSPAATAAAAGHYTVYIVQPDPTNAKTWGFDPASLVVPPGTTVTWQNLPGNEFHTVTAYDGSFDSSTINAGDSWSFTFAKVGVFKYHCTPHPWMQAVIDVEAGAALPAQVAPPSAPAAAAAAPAPSSPAAMPGTGPMAESGVAAKPAGAPTSVPSAAAAGSKATVAAPTAPSASAPAASSVPAAAAAVAADAPSPPAMSSPASGAQKTAGGRGVLPIVVVLAAGVAAAIAVWLRRHRP